MSTRDRDLLLALLNAARERPAAWNTLVRRACQYGKHMDARPAEFRTLAGKTVGEVFGMDAGAER